MSISLLLVFAMTEFLMALTPGPAVLLVISQSLSSGHKASLRGTLGILTGNLIYFTLSAMGLGALLMASADLFQIIRYTGAAYLVFVGVSLLFSKKSLLSGRNQIPAPALSLRLFSQGLITQLSNPKAVLFFTALLPQFVTPGGSIVEQFVILGLVSIAVEFPVLIAYGWIGERGGALIPDRFTHLPGRIAGGFLILAGVGLATVRRS